MTCPQIPPLSIDEQHRFLGSLNPSIVQNPIVTASVGSAGGRSAFSLALVAEITRLSGLPKDIAHVIRFGSLHEVQHSHHNQTAAVPSHTVCSLRPYFWDFSTAPSLPTSSSPSRSQTPASQRCVSHSFSFCDPTRATYTTNQNELTGCLGTGTLPLPSTLTSPLFVHCRLATAISPKETIFLFAHPVAPHSPLDPPLINLGLRF